MNSIVEHGIQYLSDKQCANGGFCAYKMEYLEEPNPRDTFFAVASFQLLGEAVPDCDRVEAYVHKVLTDLKKYLLPPIDTSSEIHSSEIHSAAVFNYLYFPFYTLYRIGRLHLDEFWQHILRSLEILLPEQMHLSESGTNQYSLLQKVRTKKLGGTIPNQEHIIEFVWNLKNKGGFGIKPNLIDTYWSISLLKELDYDLNGMDDTRQFIQRLQVPQTGFTLTEEGIMTSLEVVYAGIFASLMLQMEIPHLDAALRFVRMCQTDRGGFARMPVGVPDIESTYRALKVLVLVKTAF